MSTSAWKKSISSTGVIICEKEYKRNVKNYRIKIRSWELLNLICHMAMNTVQKSEVERYKRDILKKEQDRMS